VAAKDTENGDEDFVGSGALFCDAACLSNTLHRMIRMIK
jgi:hypothetical protein